MVLPSFFDGVPLVYHNDAALALLVGIARNLAVLVGKALDRVSMTMTQTSLRSTAI
jgi:hypothetical protein